MSKLVDLVSAPGFDLEVKQFECVLDYVTAIEEAMEAKQVTQSALARTLGKTRAWISKALGKKRNLTFFTAVELANALDLDVEVRVVSRSSVSFEMRESVSRLLPAGSPAEAWSSEGIRMRSVAPATVIPYPRAA